MRGLKNFSIIALLTIASFGCATTSSANRQLILPGKLNLPLIDGTKILRDCQGNQQVNSMICIVLDDDSGTRNPDDIGLYKHTYLESLTTLGWQKFYLGHGEYALEKPMPNTQCSENLVLASHPTGKLEIILDGFVVKETPVAALIFEVMPNICGNERPLK